MEMLPFDIKYYIYEIYCANIISRNFRRSKHRHCKFPKWKIILKKLIDKITTEKLELLMNQYWIRKEWKNEPESWIYMLDNEPFHLFEIIEEVSSV